LNSKELFKQCKAKAENLPELIATKEMLKTVMMAEISQWIYNAEPYIDGRNISDNLVRTAAETIDLINDFLNQ
jgi:hypothetical protein